MSFEASVFGVFVKRANGKIVRVPCTPETTVGELRGAIESRGGLNVGDALLFRGVIVDEYCLHSTLREVGIRGEQMVTVIPSAERATRTASIRGGEGGGQANYRSGSHDGASLHPSPVASPPSRQSSATGLPLIPSREDIARALSETGMALSEMDLDPRNKGACSPMLASLASRAQPRSASFSMAMSAERVSRSKQLYEEILCASSPCSPAFSFQSARSPARRQAKSGGSTPTAFHGKRYFCADGGSDEKSGCLDHLEASSGSWGVARPKTLRRSTSVPEVSFSECDGAGDGGLCAVSGNRKRLYSSGLSSQRTWSAHGGNQGDPDSCATSPGATPQGSPVRAHFPIVSISDASWAEDEWPEPDNDEKMFPALEVLVGGDP